MIQHLMNVSLIIPAYNEEKNISNVIKRIPPVVDETIVVNDGSNDRTAEVVSKHPVKLVSHKTHLGKGLALKTGSDNSTGQVLVFMDGDGQHDPSDIRSLIMPIISGESDLVLGYRNLQDAPRIRKFSNFLARTAIKFFTRQEVNDPLCGFRAISKDAFNKLNLTKEGYEFEFDMIFEALKNDVRMANVPVSVDYDVGVSSITFLDNVKIIFFVLKECVKKKFRIS